MRNHSKRRGVASVIGMLFMVLVFMLAIGSLVYLSGLQAQASHSAAEAQLLVSQRADESLAFSTQGPALSATDTGPGGVQVVGMVLRFENGTSYVLGTNSTPRFTPAYLASGGAVTVQSLVPSSPCTPGTATCASKYASIVQGQVPGRGVALVTSLGNTFWYVPSASGQGTGSGQAYYVVSSTESTTSSTFVGIPGLSLTGGADSFYVVRLSVVFYQSNPSSPVIAFAISVSTGSSFLFCGGLYWANPSQSTSDFPPGNLCSTQANVSLGPTMTTQTTCVQQGTFMCEFMGTAYVSFGSAGGTFQFEFKGSSTDTATVVAGSSMAVAAGS
jgi:hypothetical protein